VSLPFLTPSLQAEAWQTPFKQTPLAQSAPPVQPWPGAQGGQAPPQSTAVSVPFSTPSAQVAAAQIPLTQTPLAQPAPSLQCEPSAQGWGSQPFAGFPSQSKKPGLQKTSSQVPP